MYIALVNDENPFRKTEQSAACAVVSGRILSPRFSTAAARLPNNDATMQTIRIIEREPTRFSAVITRGHVDLDANARIIADASQLIERARKTALACDWAMNNARRDV